MKTNHTWVNGIKRLYRGVYAVEWCDSLNHPRSILSICRKVDGKWTTGEAHPTGVHNGGIIRPVHPEIAKELDSITAIADYARNLVSKL